jgi:hypothetical protein
LTSCTQLRGRETVRVEYPTRWTFLASKLLTSLSYLQHMPPDRFIYYFLLN